jgi:hypothetical protein
VDLLKQKLQGYTLDRHSCTIISIVITKGNRSLFSDNPNFSIHISQETENYCYQHFPNVGCHLGKAREKSGINLGKHGVVIYSEYRNFDYNWRNTRQKKVLFWVKLLITYKIISSHITQKKPWLTEIRSVHKSRWAIHYLEY